MRILDKSIEWRGHFAFNVVKGCHLRLKLSKVLYSGMYCLFLLIGNISFQKLAPRIVFSIAVAWPFARLNRHLEFLIFVTSAERVSNLYLLYLRFERATALTITLGWPPRMNYGCTCSCNYNEEYKFRRHFERYQAISICCLLSIKCIYFVFQRLGC